MIVDLLLRSLKHIHRQKSFSFCIVLLLCVPHFFLTAYLSQAQQNRRNPVQEFGHARRLYALNNPTEESDAKALMLFLGISASKHPSVTSAMKIESLISGGNIHQGYGRFKEARNLYHQAIQLNNTKDIPNPKLAYEAYLYLGSSMYFNGILDSAKYYFERTSEISIAYRSKVKLPEQDRLYNSLGAIYYEAANYQQAKNFFETALDLAMQRKEDYNEYYTTLQTNIANCLLKFNKHDSAIKILSSLKPVPAQKSQVLQALAHAYFEKGSYDSALRIYKMVSLPTGFYKIVSLNEIGRIYLLKNQPHNARIFFDSAIQQNNLLTGNLKNREEALSYLWIAELLNNSGKIDEAIIYTNKALNEIHLSFQASNLYEVPEDVSSTVSPINFYRILLFKAGLLFRKYNTGKDHTLLKASLKTYVKALETANFISKNFDNDDARIFFLGNSKSFYEQAVEVAYQTCKADPACLGDFLFVLESYKGSVLRQNLEYGKLKKNAGIPDSLLTKEHELKSLYAAYLTKLNMTVREDEAKQIHRKLGSLMLELSGLQRQYEKFEQYNHIKKNIDLKNIPVEQIQDFLDKNTAVVNYFIGRNSVFILVISKQQINVEKVEVTTEYLNALHSFFTESLRIQEGKRFGGYDKAHTLFRYLIEPVYPSLKRLSRMIIIPDGYLYYLPFDALTRTRNKKDYLLFDHSISFHYSINLLLGSMESPKSHSLHDSTLSFAPFTGGYAGKAYPGFMELPFSMNEVDYDFSRKFIGNKATKEEFLSHYHHYRILHLATHASLGKDSSSNWIQFFPDSSSLYSGRLYVHEIYNLKLSMVDLVILSACETGSGLTAGGEGLLSISRAFMYAGAEGIISTLYKTEDRVTAFLMKRLSHYLGKGKSPEEALRLSKIDFIESHETGLRVKSPNYWSNFIYIGKVAPASQSKADWFFWTTIITLFTGAYFFIRSSRRSSTTQ